MKEIRRISRDVFLLLAFVFAIVIILTISLPKNEITSQTYPAPIEQTSRDSYPPPEPPLTTTAQPVGLIGPACYVDKLNRFSLYLPSGWRADVPPSENAIGGASVFYNYTQDDIKMDHGSLILPPNSVKIQITSGVLLRSQSFEQWINIATQQMLTSDIAKQFQTVIGTPYPYNLAEQGGIAYTVKDSSGTDALVINLPSRDRVIIISIAPAGMESLASFLLSSLDTMNLDGCNSEAISPEESIPKATPTTETFFENHKETNKGGLTCELGTFPGTEAHNSQISLQMPFPLGETWIVGGGGSFYGNNHHCNFYNNYYATDWNKAVGNDDNALVLATADGNVSEIDILCQTRYGCYVKIDHASGYRTLYAHLKSILVQTEGGILKIV